MHKHKWLLATACLALLLTGCNKQDAAPQPQPQQKQAEPSKDQTQKAADLQTVTYTADQKKKIQDAASKANIKTAYIPTSLPKDNTFTDVLPAQSLFNIQYNNLVVTESTSQLVPGGAIVNQKDTKLKDGTPARWVSTSTTADNKDGASAKLYFKMGDTYISLGTGKADFDATVEAIADTFKPVT